MCTIIIGYYAVFLFLMRDGPARLVIPEGSTMYQVADRVAACTYNSRDQFLDACLDLSFLSSIGIDAPTAEGYLYPDTYLIDRHSSSRALITMMHRRLRNITASIAKTNNRGLGFHQIITLASIIEKEATDDRERPKIARVFLNRLAAGMRLESCPTVRYALKKFKGRITNADVQCHSSLNTYRHTGLPPSAICSPGRASIAAVYAPAPGRFLFFVARHDGSHYFSNSYHEHKRAADYYLHGADNGFVDNQRD